MTVKGGTSQACAACKYQRRKCAADCALAPYFPPDKPKMFQNAHRLFGVSNILKILKQLSPSQKGDAMGSIIYQSYIRDKFPVHGCFGFICQLKFQIEQLQQELLAVQTQLAMYRQEQHHLLSSSSSPPPLHSPSSQLQLGMANSPSPINALPFNALPTSGISLTPTHYHHNDLNNPNLYNTSGYIDSKENMVNPLWIQTQNLYITSPNASSNNAATQSPLLISQALPIQQEPMEAIPDYDEIPSFFETNDDRLSCIDSKEANESSSSEDSLKQTTQPIKHVQDRGTAYFNFTTTFN